MNSDLNEWTNHLREILQSPDTPLTLKNGKWGVKDRKILWQKLGPRIFNKDLENFKNIAVTILKEKDPKFDLPREQRFAASIYGKILTYSNNIRRGVAEGLALLGTQPEALINCSKTRAEDTAILTVREVLNSSDWRLWGTLDTLLPTVAEAAPTEFLNAVERELQSSPCPFDMLFLEEGDGITGGSNISGLLWALETLAWDKEYIVRSCALLGNLASRDPGGQYSNRPSNSLTEILLPWKPHTTANFDKRKAVMKTLEKEDHSVAWKLALSLLPNQKRISSGSYKPKWREIIPDDGDIKISHKEYWDQILFFSECAVSMAKDDINKLSELVNYLDDLPKPSFDKLLKYLSSDKIINKPEEERLEIWEKLVNLIKKHKAHHEAKWALNSDELSKIESVAKKITPVNPMNSHHRLFNTGIYDLYDGEGDWKEQQLRLEELRDQAIREILEYNDINAVLEFAESVESPFDVGYSLSHVTDISIDNTIIPEYLITDNKKLQEFVIGFVKNRQRCLGWVWVDELDKSKWSKSQISTFLSYLPFNDEAWERASTFLKDYEGDYWRKTYVIPDRKDSNIELAVDKLIKYGRPNAAIYCLYVQYFEKKLLDKSRTVNALLSAVASKESSNTMDIYHVQELIKALQNDPDIDHDELFRVEWAYLPILDRLHGISPKELESQLTSDSAFFCDLISRIYLSSKGKKSDKKISESDKAIAENAWRLLDMWQKPPGTQADGSFSGNKFNEWLNETKETCIKSGHLEVALIHVGKVLFYCPTDPGGLWINETVANELNKMDNDKMLNGYATEIINSRGAHFVDPTGEPERKLAEEYRGKADDLENAGYHRFAASLKNVAKSYEREAEENIAEYIEEDV